VIGPAQTADDNYFKDAAAIDELRKEIGDVKRGAGR
jgi:hypothetical protein